MSDKPIIFCADSIRQILAGRKAMTMRVIVPQPMVCAQNPLYLDWKGATYDLLAMAQHVRYPYGTVLWVKETWAKVPMSAYWHDSSIPHRELRNSDGRGDGWWAIYREGWVRCAPRWESPLFMPRWASRLTLRVVSTKVERLQDISPEDVIAAGLPTNSHSAFMAHWDSLNAKRGSPWAANPWVECPTFEVVK